jgi:hypothetical protein
LDVAKKIPAPFSTRFLERLAMLRVSCSCGKVLKLNDELAGKQIRCPQCKAVLAVKAPAPAAVSARPMRRATANDGDDEAVASGPAPVRRKAAPPPDDDGPSTPLPKKKKAMAVDDDDESPRPKKKSRAEDDEYDDDDRPRKKKKKAEKGSPVLLYALVGGGVFVLLLLVGVSVGAYFLFFNKGSSKTADGGSAATDKGPGTKSDPIAVKFHVPLKVGDVREITADYDENVKIDAQGGGKGFAPEPNINAKIKFQGKVKTLEVDADGQQTRGEITVTSLSITRNGKETSVAPGTVILQQAQKNLQKPQTQMFMYQLGPKEKGFLALEGMQAMMDILGKRVPSATPDKIWGTSKKRAVGDTWPVNKNGALLALKDDVGGELNLPEDSASGNMKFIDMPKEGGTTLLEFKGDYKVTANNAKISEMGVNVTVNGTFDVSTTMRFPRDYSTGPVKITGTTAVKATVDYDDKLTVGRFSADGTKSFTMTIKYEGGGDSDKTQDPKKDDSKKKKRPPG